MADVVDVIDFSRWTGGEPAARAALAAEIDRACRETGFLRIRNHGIDAGLIAEVQAVTRAFFALDVEAKAALVYEPPHGNRGYAPMGGEALGATYGDSGAQPDLFEAFSIGPVGRPNDAYHRHPDAGRFFEPNLFPAEPAAFAQVWPAYYRACERLADALMSAFAAALGLSEAYFAPFVDRHITAMRALHYPPLAAPPPPGQHRIGPHTDFGSLTVLLSDGTPGLQVHRDGTWRDVALRPEELLVNIGDLMADWTNGRWTSTLHRVIPSAYEQDRLTITYFHHPNYDAVIEPLPATRHELGPEAAAVTAGAYLAQKLEALRVKA